MNSEQLKTIREQVAQTGARIQLQLLPHDGLPHRNAFAHIWLGVKTVFGEHWREGAQSSEVGAFVAWIGANPNASYESFDGEVTPCLLLAQKAPQGGLFDDLAESGDSAGPPIPQILFCSGAILWHTPAVKKSISIVAFTASVLGGLCLAWSPTAVTTLGGGPNDQVQAKVSAGSNGEFFVSWFDNATGGYDVRANRFSASGSPMWGSNGTLVADRSYSSTVDYSSWRCSGDRFAVAYNDDRLGGDRISFSLLSASGAITWTTTVGTAGASVANPKVCEDPFDGSIYGSWLEGSSSRVQKFDAVTGALLWATPITIQDGTAQTWNVDLWPAADTAGGIMLSCVRQVGFTGAKTLKAWRISPAGVVGWTTGSTAPAVVFSTGSLQIGNYPPCQSIPGIGYVFCWYTSSPLQCYVQFLDTLGIPKFGTSGVAVASTTALNRVGPYFAVDAAADRMYVVCPENVPNTSTYSVMAQSFALSGTGTRLWGEMGRNLLPSGTLYSADFVGVRCGNGAATFAWQSSTSFGQTSLSARRINIDGTDAWVAGTVLVDTAGSKSKMVSVRQSDASVFIWSAGATGGASDVVAQRVGNDRSIGGNPSVPGDLNEDGAVDGIDLTIILAAWGTNDPIADVNHDNIVDGADMAVVLAAWS